MGTIRKKPLKLFEQFPVVDDVKLRLSVMALADKYSEIIRELIYRTYDDAELHLLYRSIRTSGIYQHGGKSKVRRKIVEFPNPYVYDFVDTVLRTLYGPDWLTNPKALRHELVRPWWVVEKL